MLMFSMPRYARILVSITALIFGWFLVLYVFVVVIAAPWGMLAKLFSSALLLGGFASILKLAGERR